MYENLRQFSAREKVMSTEFLDAESYAYTEFMRNGTNIKSETIDIFQKHKIHTTTPIITRHIRHTYVTFILHHDKARSHYS